MAGAARWVPSRADRPHLRANGQAGAPPSRRGASCTRGPAPGAKGQRCGIPGAREPTARPQSRSAALEQSQESAGEQAPPARDATETRGNSRAAPTSPLRAVRQPEREGTKRGPALPRSRGPPEALCIPPLALGPRPTPAQAYLVLDLGREPVGRALVEVGHDGSGGGKRLRSGPGVPRTRLPRSWPRGAAAPQDAWSSLSWAAQESPGRGGRTRAVPWLLGPTRSRRASRSAPESRTNCPPPPPPGLRGLADESDQWRAASSRLSGEGAARPIEGRRAPLPLPARVPAPAPALTPHRPAATRPLLRARPTRQRRRSPASAGSRPRPRARRPGASQRPGVHVDFQASAWGRRRGGKPTRAGPRLTRRLALPPPRPQAQRAHVAGRAPPPAVGHAGAALESLCPRRRAPPSSDTCLLLPYLAASHTCWSDLYPAAAKGTVKALGQIRAHSVYAVRENLGSAPRQSLAFQPVGGHHMWRESWCSET